MIGPLTFLNPWILAGLAFLPVLWFLLRVTPPAPRRMVFPAARFLAGLVPEDQTASRTPWWILLMRLLAAALIITALARPVINQGEALTGDGAARIVVDNGWASARNWPMMMQTAAEILDRAARQHRPVYIMTTAPEPGTDKPIHAGPLAKGQAEATLRGLAPRPWPADYTAAGDLLSSSRNASSIHSFFLSHGMADNGDLSRFMRDLQSQGSLSVYRPDPAHFPLLVRPVKNAGTDVESFIDAVPGVVNGLPVSVQALGAQGRVIDIKRIELDARDLPNKIRFDMPEPLRGQVSRISLTGRPGAGGLWLSDEQAGRRSVGIVAPGGDQATPLADANFYINRALAPYAELHSAPVSDLLKLKPSVMILPDIGAMPAEDLNALEEWVKQGGLLLRFAGPNMSQAESFLTPVPLRSGGRALNGSLTWEKPLHISPFPEGSPYHGIQSAPDITVRQQILAEPVDGMEKKVWASLDDGTPLITAGSLGRGLLVMVHTTATPAWSDLALSGLFVQVLRRTINMAGSGIRSSEVSGGALQPLQMVDGFGALVQPDASVEPIAADHIEDQKIDSRHPPGIYGRSGVTRALNLGDQLTPLRTFDNLPMGAEELSFGVNQERDLMPYLLAAALLLFMADWFAMIVLQTGWRLRLSALFIASMLFFTPMTAHAQGDTDVKYAGNIYLAYVSSGNTSIDADTQAGLQNLAQVLTDRTSVEPAGVVAVNPEQDEMAFFPLIYWPVSEASPPLSEKALRRVQAYLDHGGTILFDTSDQNGPSGENRNGPALQRIAGALNIPPLIPMPKDHVLTRSFYLMRSMPGRYDNGVIWVEDQSANGRDGVSSVIVGSNGWASGWAADAGQLSGGERQKELAMRAGVNIMMYALTGNYKADQVHLPEIIERLGE